MNKEMIAVLKENEKLICKIASKFYGLDFEDLYQAGAIGLIKAYRNYKESSKAKFSTYAYEYIFGEMYEFSMKCKSFKVNKETLKLYRKIEEARAILTQTMSRVPNNYELASFLKMDEEVINNIQNSAINMLSLDDETIGNNLHDVIAQDNEINIDDNIIIKDSLNTLNDSEKDIIYYRYFKDFTQSETAKKLNMTQAMISRYEKLSLKKMGQYIAS